VAILWGRPPKYFMSINPKKFKEEYGITEPKLPPSVEKTSGEKI